MDVKEMPVEPVLVRGIIRNGNWPKPTPGLTPGSAQVNLAILPKELAYDFLLFCQHFFVFFLYNYLLFFGF